MTRGLGIDAEGVLVLLEDVLVWSPSVHPDHGPKALVLVLLELVLEELVLDALVLVEVHVEASELPVLLEDVLVLVLALAFGSQALVLDVLALDVAGLGVARQLIVLQGVRTACCLRKSLIGLQILRSLMAAPNAEIVVRIQPKQNAESQRKELP